MAVLIAVGKDDKQQHGNRSPTEKKFLVAPNYEFRIGETTFRFELLKPPPVGKPTVVEHTFAREHVTSPMF